MEKGITGLKIIRLLNFVVLYVQTYRYYLLTVFDRIIAGGDYKNLASVDPAINQDPAII